MTNESVFSPERQAGKPSHVQADESDLVRRTQGPALQAVENIADAMGAPSQQIAHRAAVLALMLIDELVLKRNGKAIDRLLELLPYGESPAPVRPQQVWVPWAPAPRTARDDVDEELELGLPVGRYMTIHVAPRPITRERGIVGSMVVLQATRPRREMLPSYGGAESRFARRLRALGASSGEAWTIIGSQPPATDANRWNPERPS